MYLGRVVETGPAGRVFAAFGLHPVGFYDLRNSDGTGVPVVATAFRPIAEDELARNPFRIFTSMLTSDDPRFFDRDVRARLESSFARRELFAPQLVALADRAADLGELAPDDATELVERATDAFRLARAPIDRAWHEQLARISSVAADIGGPATTHINHLTPGCWTSTSSTSAGCAAGRSDRSDPGPAGRARPRRPAATDLVPRAGRTTVVP